MICTPCKKAGIKHYHYQAHLDKNENPKGQLNRIRKLHSDCPGGTWCDCQHVIGLAVNETILPQRPVEL